MALTVCLVSLVLLLSSQHTDFKSPMYVASGLPVMVSGTSLSIRKATRKMFMPASRSVWIASGSGQIYSVPSSPGMVSWPNSAPASFDPNPVYYQHLSKGNKRNGCVHRNEDARLLCGAARAKPATVVAYKRLNFMMDNG